MGAAGLGAGFDEGEGGGAVEGVELGAGGGALGVGGLLDPDVGVGDEFAASAEGEIAGPGGVGWGAVDEGVVGLADGALFHGAVEGVGSFVVFCDDDDAGGLAVEAIDDGEGGSIGDVVDEEFAESFE